MVKNRQEVLNYLKKHKNEFGQKYSVTKMGLFGSFARDEARSNSDVDILVELKLKTLDNYMDLKFQMEDELERKVDLLSCEPKPRAKKSIMEDLIYV